jgi:hypothetical protein
VGVGGQNSTSLALALPPRKFCKKILCKSQREILY